jgi:hypothetical protein
MSPNIAASVRARLLNQAMTQREEFERTLVRYADERLLYRLGASAAREQCVLKGASLLTAWIPDPYRATRDVDVLTLGSPDDGAIRKLVEEICSVPCPEDGLRFDLSELVVEDIRGGVHREACSLRRPPRNGADSPPDGLRLWRRTRHWTLRDRLSHHAGWIARATTSSVSARSDRGGEIRGHGFTRHAEQPHEGLSRCLGAIERICVRRFVASKVHRGMFPTSTHSMERRAVAMSDVRVLPGCCHAVTLEELLAGRRYSNRSPFAIRAYRRRNHLLRRPRAQQHRCS